MDAILYPIMVAVAWIMVRVHDLLVFLGMSAGSGWAWILSIVGLVIVIRILLIPLFFKQIKASRGLQLVQPEMQALQKKYKNKTDPASRQKMQEEMMALYRKHGTNPFASCLPILLQMPIFFALFSVLNRLDDIGAGTSDGIGPLTQDLAAQAESSELLGAPISETFLSSPDPTVKIVTVLLIVAMSITTFLTQRQLTMKNMPAAALDNPMMRQQKLLMYLLPLVFAFSGVNFPIGVLIYWTTTNLWSMGQQWYTIRRQPAPGSEAARLRAERLARRRARKGLPPVEEPAAEEAAAPEAPRGQRPQPKRKERAKRPPTGATPVVPPPAAAEPSEPAAVPDPAAAPGEGPGAPGDDGQVRGKDGLTAAERAQKRYEERAAERRAAAARRQAQSKKGKRPHR